MSKQSKIWIFFELVEKDHSSVFRGIATDKKTKERFERALTDEMAIKASRWGLKNRWSVEENLSNHLFGEEMFKASTLIFRNYRNLDGD